MDPRLYFQEKVKFNTEIIKVLALIALTTISGEITIFYQWDVFSGRAFILAFFGLIAIFVMIGTILAFYRDNVKLIEKLK